MKSVHVIISIGFSLIILAGLTWNNTIVISDLMMIGYSLAGFFLTISAVIHETSDLNSFWPNFAYVSFLFLGIFFLIFSPYSEVILSKIDNINFLTNYCTIASIGLILISLGVKEDTENKASKKKASKKV